MYIYATTIITLIIKVRSGCMYAAWIVYPVDKCHLRDKFAINIIVWKNVMRKLKR